MRLVLSKKLSEVAGRILGMTPEEFQHHTQQTIAAGWDCLRALSPDQTAEAVALFEAITSAEAQLAGLRLALLHEARHLDSPVVLDAVRTSTRTNQAHTTGMIKLSAELSDRFPIIQAALCDGYISIEQAHAICSGLAKLPAQYSKADLETCQQQCLQHIHELGPKELRQLAARMAELIDPEGAEAEEAKRMEREERKAHAGRFLRLRPDFHGSMTITGKLPLADGSLLAAQIDALMPSLASYRETAETPTPDMRRADALVRLAGIAANSGDLPAQGGDRPQVQVTMSLDGLTSMLGRAEVLNNGQPVSPSVARRLCCDADLIPVVLGGDSQPLDVGRTRRLFTKPQRQLLTLRDQGCAFPSCDASPAACQGHHIIPWIDGGPTDLNHAVLVCPYHHRVVEPDHSLSPEQQWEVHLDPNTMLPWFTPPRHIDPQRRPRQHRRYRLRHIDLTPNTKAPSCPESQAPSCPDPEGSLCPDLEQSPCPVPEPTAAAGAGFPLWQLPPTDDSPWRVYRSPDPDPREGIWRVLEQARATRDAKPAVPNPWHPDD